MVHRDCADKHAIRSHLELFKVDSKEALLLTGEEHPVRVAQAVPALGPKLVLLTHQGGVCVFDGQATYSAAFDCYSLAGRTGRGDTCPVSFLVARARGLNLPQAVAFAADVTTRQTQYRGPFQG